jgi:galactose mutarotase-like enzyme
MSDTATLRSGRLHAVVDLGRGAEIASLRDLTTGTELLLSTPWAERARAVRPLRLTHPAAASEAHWMESYAGGWQTLFPHAGPPALIDGVERHYHGEASSVPWVVDELSETSVTAHVELYTVPVRVDRVVGVADGRITVSDTLTNSSAVPVTYDYQSHPAFGAPFIERGCTIETGASAYTPDGRFDLGEFAPGIRTSWPKACGMEGEIDLSRVPGDDEHLMRFGWLDGFDVNRVTISNPHRGVAVTIEWPDDARRYAWLWEEIHAHPSHPWYAVAIEPSTRPTEAPAADAPRLEPDATATYTTTLAVHDPRPGAAFATKEPA